MFRGREMAHPERGEALLRKLADEIAEFGTIEQQPNQEGRNMTMVMAPVRAPARKPERPAETDAALQRRPQHRAAGGGRSTGRGRAPAEAEAPASRAPAEADARAGAQGGLARTALALPPRRAHATGACGCVRREEDDAHAIAAGCSDPEIARWTNVPSPYTLEDARGWIALAAIEREREAVLHARRSCARATTAWSAAARCGCTTQPEPHGEIGYWVAADARGAVSDRARSSC